VLSKRYSLIFRVIRNDTVPDEVILLVCFSSLAEFINVA